jgi:hypothetical protein
VSIRSLPIRDELAQRYLSRYVNLNMHHAVLITRMTDPVFDSTTGTLSAQLAEVVYSGAARIYSVTGPVTYSLGDEPQFFSTTYVSIPLEDGWDEPRRADVVEIVASPNDPAMVGRQFQVTDVEAGGQYTACRRLSVIGVQESQNWNHA